jgi:iron complex transport system substrate-binding protein
LKIASLVPSATETLFALGLGDSVVAVTHECDYPQAAESLPHLTRSVVPEGLSSAEIDRAVRDRTERGEALYELDGETLEELRPDLIVTQALCEVCAVSVDDVRAVAATLEPVPRVLSLDPTTLGEVLADVHELARAAGVPERGDALVADAERRLETVRRAVAGAERRRVVALEWLDPPFVGGHWVPEMVELAGGEDPYTAPGDRSRTVDWEEIRAGRPEVAVSMPCGYYVDDAEREAREHAAALDALGVKHVFAVDAAAYFSRPGPRLVDGVELLAGLLHPDQVEPRAEGAREVQLSGQAA